jgi:diacylglycerol kinase family enzyme
VPIQLDGDPAGFTPVEIDVIPEGLAVLMPYFHKRAVV